MEHIRCPKCDAPVDYGLYDGRSHPCPECRRTLRIDVFPAFLRPIDSGAPGTEVPEDEASCFYHPSKKAETTCDYCGRFLCGLCTMDMGGKRLCPSCLDAGRKKGRLVDLERHRTLYDSMALILAVLPLLLLWITWITAPAALYLAIRHWKSPGSIVRTGKGRLVAAIAVSGIQILGWAFGIAFLVSLRY